MALIPRPWSKFVFFVNAFPLLKTFERSNFKLCRCIGDMMKGVVRNIFVYFLTVGRSYFKLCNDVEGTGQHLRDLDPAYFFNGFDHNVS